MTTRYPSRRGGNIRFGLALLTSIMMLAAAAGSASALTYTSEAAIETDRGTTGTVEITNQFSEKIKCTGGGGTGNLLKNTDEGYLNFLLTGCREQNDIFKFNCQTSGAATGEIKFKPLKTQLVYLDAAKTQYGLLLSPGIAGDPMAAFDCPGYLNKFKWTGSLIVEITSPALNVSTNNFTWVVQAAVSGYTQKYEQIEGAGTYHMSEQFEGGNPHSVTITMSSFRELDHTGKFLP